MKVLDLFCGAGGAAMGLHRAWPDAAITGVDIKPMPRYPFEFIQADAMYFPLEGYDFIWASPPCQRYSVSSLNYRMAGKQYPDLLGATRDRLEECGAPYTIENVPKAPMRADLVLCGSQFGLEIARHRLFECNWPVFQLLPRCAHVDDVVTVCGHGAPSWSRSRKLRGEKYWKDHEISDCKRAMGIDWMIRSELVESVPPAYSEFIARQFRS